ncbi:uncharacterized protein BXIN_1706 [Babesia sp. Xinjiang]|uniref:uncharacterized protein n=1 Tax=Babesia sp. Xinjiang TaxID=462227 RepID=UPI000A217AA0|nr:uncharacterized protein BXIN_1706 [Babesia sp. Xinjiang]ORM40910.1 hypothetical protein BXIN_1706 [Babesia sp. Xinjiang]
MFIVGSLLVFHALLLIGGIDGFRVLSSQRAPVAVFSKYRTPVKDNTVNLVDDANASLLVGDVQGTSIQLLRARPTDDVVEDSNVDVSESTDVEDLPSDDRYRVPSELGAGSMLGINDLMYIIFRVFDSLGEVSEEECRRIIMNSLSSLVQERFFDLYVYREVGGNLPPLLLARFNNFNAYEFVRVQLYARDPSTAELLRTFYFHTTRYSIHQDPNTISMSSYIRNRMYRGGRMNPPRGGIYGSRRVPPQRYSGMVGYDRVPPPVQYPGQSSGMAPMYQQPPPPMPPPPHLQHLQMHTMMLSPHMMGPPGHEMGQLSHGPML